MNEMPLCECGCGERVTKKGNRFIHNHHRRGAKHTVETRELMSSVQKDLWDDQYMRDAQSVRRKRYNLDHPEAIEANRLRGIAQFATQESRDEMSRIKKQWFIDNPEEIEACSTRMINIWDDPEYRQMMSEIRLNSVSAQFVYDMQRGGNDICWHHVAYDFGDPDALRVRITRKHHSSIHHPQGIPVTVRGYVLTD